MATSITSQGMESSPIDERTKKMVLYIGIFSIVMLFAGFSSAYVISSYNEIWVNLSMPDAFYISTVLILLSSLTMKLAVNASNKGNEGNATALLGVTLLLGLGFGASQYMGWNELLGQGSHLSGHIDNLDGVYGEDYTISYQGQELVYVDGEYYLPNDELKEKPLTDEIAVYSNSTASYIYILSFVHLMHVLGGILFLAGILIASQVGKKKRLSNLRLRLGSIYWHFVDGLWLYLLFFLLLIH
ncbi:MAG: cytochrome c oxidase subunit 3 [Cryomorphaceae bacterium]|jgi:cytochrome c oxidase subunit 3